MFYSVFQFLRKFKQSLNLFEYFKTAVYNCSLQSIIIVRQSDKSDD